MGRIGFIGTGNMAEAIIKGLKASKNDYVLTATDANPERLQQVADTYGVIRASLGETVVNSDEIVIAVKPKDIVNVLNNLKGLNMANKLVMSVAAGIPIKIYEEYLPDISIVRCMPNTSSAVLHSMTGLAKGKNVSEAQAEMAELIFKQIGQTLWVDETQMNTVTAISGSGPAYFYYFTECLMKAGVGMGLSPEQAQTLAIETLIGAGKMIAQSQRSPSELREQVTSPNGTTYAALVQFKEADLEVIVLKAAKAAQERGYEMEGEYSK